MIQGSIIVEKYVEWIKVNKILLIIINLNFAPK